MSVQKHVDLAVYRANLESITQAMAPAKVMAVVKADAYGHGLLEISKAAVESGIDMLGVLDIETGLELRKAGIKVPCFAWLHSPQSNFAAAVKFGIELSVSSLAELNTIGDVQGVAKVHLKVDTGLSRNGCRFELWPELVGAAMELQKIGKIDIVAVWSHLSGTSREEDLKALSLFEEASQIAVSGGFTGYRHIAASPAAYSLPESRYDLVRIGVSAFGTSPLAGVEAAKLGLESPMTLTAEVIDTGIVSVGFLHGYFSRLANRSKVLIGEKPYRVLEVGPLASRIESGDYLPGDEVIVFGGSAMSAEEICNLAETVTDELFTGLKATSVSYSD
jgi:alanine racemase